MDGGADRTEDGSARLRRAVTIGGKSGEAMVYTEGDLALLVFGTPGAGGKTEYRNVLLDGAGEFGRRGQVYVDITDTQGVRRAVPGVAKYVQAAADIMTQRTQKLFVARQ